MAKITREQARQRDEKTGVQIDDTLMRQTMRDNKAAPASTPFPWMKKEWAGYKETMEEKGVVYVNNRV